MNIIRAIIQNISIEYWNERRKSQERKDQKRRSSSRKRHKRHSHDNSERKYKHKKYHTDREDDERSSDREVRGIEGRYKSHRKTTHEYNKRKGYDGRYEDRKEKKYAKLNSENESQNEEEHKPASQEDWDKDLVSKRNKNDSKPDEGTKSVQENKIEEIRITEPKIISLNQRNNDLRKGQTIMPPKKSIQEVNEKDEEDKTSSKFVIKQEGNRRIIETKLLKAATETTPKNKDDLREKIKALRGAENPEKSENK